MRPMRFTRRLLTLSVLLAVAASPAIGAWQPLWLSGHGDSARTATLAAEHGELHLLLHSDGLLSLGRAPEGSPSIGETAQEVHVSDGDSRLVGAQRQFSHSVSFLPVNAIESGRAASPRVFRAVPPWDTGPPLRIRPSVLRI